MVLSLTSLLMFRLHRLFLAGMLCLLSLVACRDKHLLEERSLIPKPVTLRSLDGHFVLSDQTTISVDPSVDAPETLVDLLSSSWSCSLKLQSQGGTIRFSLSDAVAHPEGYHLEVLPEGIRLVARGRAGLLHGIQTLLQLADGKGYLPSVEIEDAPRFAYRGLMLDVSRHFYNKEFVVKLLDEMARLKLNRFHWHLVDGGGWRMQVDSYPRLMSHAAWRSIEDWDKWWHQRVRTFVPEGTEGAYGGYYTKEEIREVVAHATKLGITVVPEIEMPGHSNEVAAAYPELFCQGRWSTSVADVCIGREETFTFFERILDETLELFPSEYIHIGGDEAAMNHWGDCSKCKARMRREGLKDLHELQSYMIKRIERYLNSKGRKLIGWDEILMGGLAPEATVMSWRGEQGGIEAASAGHDVVMTPNGSLYLDYYQTYGMEQPRAIGGYVPLEKVYAYNPVPKALDPEREHHILGVQANLWTEYVGSEEQAWYMLFPRALALAEVAWSPQKSRDYEDFRVRATRYNDGLRVRGVNAYPMSGVNAHISRSEDGAALRLTLSAEHAGAIIRYTTDGSMPTEESLRYEGPIDVIDSALVVAKPFGKGIPSDVAPRYLRLDKHLALDKSVRYDCKWNERYSASKELSLVDGIKGTPTYLDGLWQGFTEPMDVTIDLGAVKPVRHVLATFMQEREQWVYMPREVEVWISEDGKAFHSIGRVASRTDEHEPRPVFETFDFYAEGKARYVRMRADIGRSPGHFIFTDEIVVW
ncbi:family 20 glycosylhydrolase [Porphyromonas sp. COT-239 OH1446]|uniref:glycoside hydrolase family 20 protein n=1 Tax=Porphyromonas sp. COT-239 OH1446 TaxID=1515613 RepID=UPI001269F5B8